MIIVTGNTYPVKEELKVLGAKWDCENKRWTLPDEAEETEPACGAIPHRIATR